MLLGRRFHDFIKSSNKLLIFNLKLMSTQKLIDELRHFVSKITQQKIHRNKLD